jgi:hypothetical protein
MIAASKSDHHHPAAKGLGHNGVCGFSMTSTFVKRPARWLLFPDARRYYCLSKTTTAEELTAPTTTTNDDHSFFSCPPSLPKASTTVRTNKTIFVLFQKHYILCRGRAAPCVSFGMTLSLLTCCCCCCWRRWTRLSRQD